jgi:copper chaperone CopZ
MHKLPLCVQIIFVAIIGFIVTPIIEAQIRNVTVTIDGMACPFCAYGVEKKLKRVDGVGSITINIKEGTAVLEAKEEESINVSQVPKAIKDSGFTPRTIKIAATGYIIMDKQQRLMLQISKPLQSLLIVDIKETTLERLLASATSGVRIKIVGIIREKSDGIFALSPQVVEDVSK